MTSKRLHWCADSDKCVCPIHNTQLFYSHKYKAHACQDPKCEYGNVVIWAGGVGHHEKAVARAVRFMHTNFRSNITMEDLGFKTTGYSKYHFSRLFASITGLTPGVFLNLMRVAEAKKLLETTTMSVMKITHYIGFSSVGTFSTKFSRIVGMPPIMYRRSFWETKMDPTEVESITSR